MPITQIESEEQLAQELASAGGKVVLAFQQEGCEPCEGDRATLEAVAAANPEVKVLAIDVTRQAAIAERYGAEATPTYLVGEAGKCSTRGRGCKEVAWAKGLDAALKK